LLNIFKYFTFPHLLIIKFVVTEIDGVSNNQTNGRPIYVNASADNRLPRQDVPPSNYLELNSGILFFPIFFNV